MEQRHPPGGGEHVGTRAAKVIGDELINLINEIQFKLKNNHSFD